jgi:hypothetical protein
LEYLTTNNYMYKDIVDEEFQHLFTFNFGVLVCGIRVALKKLVFLRTDH